MQRVSTAGLAPPRKDADVLLARKGDERLRPITRHHMAPVRDHTVDRGESS